jgi:hypothetical protein
MRGGRTFSEFQQLDPSCSGAALVSANSCQSRRKGLATELDERHQLYAKFVSGEPVFAQEVRLLGWKNYPRTQFCHRQKQEIALASLPGLTPPVACRTVLIPPRQYFPFR